MCASHSSKGNLRGCSGFTNRGYSLYNKLYNIRLYFFPCSVYQFLTVLKIFACSLSIRTFNVYFQSIKLCLWSCDGKCPALSTPSTVRPELVYLPHVYVQILSTGNKQWHFPLNGNKRSWKPQGIYTESILENHLKNKIFAETRIPH